MDVKQIYQKETGKNAWGSSNEQETGLAVYVEGPTEDYVIWLESRANSALRNGGTVPQQPQASSEASHKLCVKHTVPDNDMSGQLVCEVCGEEFERL